MRVKMNLSLLLCVLFIQVESIDPVESPVPQAEKDIYHHPNNISFELICPETPVEAVAGHPVILKCYTEPELQVERVEWLVNGSDEVHVFRGGKDQNELQNEKYKGKTSLFKDELHRGNSSLNLTADMFHSGNYCCFVYARKVDGKCYITVNVHPAEEDDTSQKHQNVTESPDKPNNNTDGLALKVVLGVGIPFVIIVIIALVYCCREHLKNFCCGRNANNPPDNVELEDLAQQPPQNQENEPEDQNPNEEKRQMLENDNQDDPAADN